MCQFLQQHRPVHCIHPPVLLVPDADVVIFVAVVSLHELDSLLKLFEGLIEDGGVERGYEVGEVADVEGEGRDAVGVDFRHSWGEGKRLESMIRRSVTQPQTMIIRSKYHRGGAAKSVVADEFLGLGLQAMQERVHNVRQI